MAEELEQIAKRIDRMRRSLATFDNYEKHIGLVPRTAQIEDTLNKIAFLRKEKANDVYRIIKKYGWLGPDIIGKEDFKTLISAIKYSDGDNALRLLPHIKAAYELGDLTEEEYVDLLDSISNNQLTQEEHSEELKTFK